MAKTLHSGNITFIDLTDSKKVDVHISSNLPTIQIYDANVPTYSPDWTSTPLVLTLTAYADSTDITNNLTNDSIKWYRQVGSGVYTELQTGGIKLQIAKNELIDKNIGWSAGVISYICSIKYNNKTFENKITFARTDTGINGLNGTDGTSVNILGTYNTLEELQTAHPTGNAGDAYIIGGNLYVWSVENAQWENVGNIQGPAGTDGRDAKSIVLSGDSQVFKVNQSNIVTPSTIKVTAQIFNTTATNWTYSINGGQTFLSTAPTGVSRSGNTVTITGSTITSNSIVIKASDGEVEDVFTIYKAFDGIDGDPGDPGAPAPIAFLTNENVTFSANAQGQISSTTITSNVVAYNGTTKVAPTIGAITGAPTGMTITPSTITASNEVMLTITIANNSTLGSASNNMGTISIPITSPVSTVLYLTWSKVNSGAIGVGIRSTTVTYGVSDSASTKPADTTWQSTIPVVEEGKYLWTRTIIDYTDDAIADTVTYTYSKQGAKGDIGSTGSSVTVSSIQYQESTSATIPPTSTWSNSIVAAAEGKFLWTKTTFSDGKIAYGVAKQGVSGLDAYTVMLTNESHIFAGDVSNAVASSASTQILAYKGTAAQSVTIVSVNGKTATTTDTDTGIVGLKFKCSALSGASPTITFTCTTSFVSQSGSIPIVLSVGGVSFTKMFTYSIAFKGTTGTPGQPASLVDITPSAYYFKSTTGKDGIFTPEFIYLYPRFQNTTYNGWQYSIDGGTTWVAVANANGLSVGTYSSVANTLRVSRVSTLYTDTVTSISFRCNSLTSGIYDTVSIAKIYDVVDLQISGRNLVLASNTPVSSVLYPIYTYQMSEDWELGTTYTITIKGSVNSGQTFGIWANGSASRVATLTYDATTGIHKATFTPTAITTQKPKTLHVYNAPSATATEASIEWIKLEKGNKATSGWSPAPEDLKSTTFQLYAPKGYLITHDVPEVTLQTFAYDGSQSITNATFKWYSWSGENWTVINAATGTSLTVNKSDVLKSSVYKCEMTYNGNVYTTTATVEDKTDIYESLIRVNAKRTSNNSMYWILYATVYSEEGERDTLLGPVSETAPAGPVTGSYWYQVNTTDYSVTLKKYSGTTWATTTDKQELSYDWFLFKDTTEMVSLGDKSKVKIVKSGDFATTCNVQCNVFDAENTILSRNNQVLNDPTDPIVSETAPANPIDGQIWIKVGTNGSYMLSIWSAEFNKWILSNADTQNKVYVTKPTQYNEGDLWIVDSNYLPVAYENDVAQTYKHPEKTMLMATATSQTYSDAHWVEALKYQKELDGVIGDMNKFKQFISIDDTGLTMQAKGANGAVSEFKTMLTNTELGFYQGAAKVAYINNNQLNISKAEITNGLVVSGTSPQLKIGNFTLIQETNGSLSIG